MPCPMSSMWARSQQCPWCWLSATAAASRACLRCWRACGTAASGRTLARAARAPHRIRQPPSSSLPPQPPATPALGAGPSDGILDQTVTLIQLHQGQRIKAIALAAPRRIPQMPDVPTFAEGGLPAFDFTIWNGVFAPKGTPKAVMAALSEALPRVIDRPEFKARLEQMAAQAPAPSERGSDALRQIVQTDQKRLAGIAQSTGLQAR